MYRYITFCVIHSAHYLTRAPSPNIFDVVNSEMGSGNLAMRSFGIGAAAAENFWRTHTRAEGVGEAAGLGVGDRYNRMLCHLQRFGIDATPIMPSFCAVVPGTAPPTGPSPGSRARQQR